MDQLPPAVAAPERFHLIELLTSLPESPIPEPHRPPRGHWILCDSGNFGHAVAHCLRDTGITLTIIDPAAKDADQQFVGDGTEAATLRRPVSKRLPASTDNDVKNLSITVTASKIKPEFFVVTRQNHAANSALFTVQPSRIVAQECIAILTAPLHAHFLERLHSLTRRNAGGPARRVRRPDPGRLRYPPSCIRSRPLGRP